MMKWNDDGTYNSSEKLQAPAGFGPQYELFKWGNGYCIVSNYNGGVAVIKTDSSFNAVRFIDWNKSFSLPCKTMGVSANISADGNLIVAAYGTYNIPSSSGTNTHLFLMKISPAGNILWMKRIPVLRRIQNLARPVETASGNIVVPGTTLASGLPSPWNGRKGILAMTDAFGRMNNCFSTDINPPFGGFQLTATDYTGLFVSTNVTVNNAAFGNTSFGSSTNDTCFRQKKPVAFFTVPPLLCTNTCISLIDASYDEPTQYEWIFNPSPDLSAVDNSCFPNLLNVCFTQPGTYSIQLVATNAFGTDTARRTIVVEAPVPAFSIGTDTTIL
jgi:hypothetical protein